MNHYLRINEINRGELGEILTSEFCLQAMAKAKREPFLDLDLKEKKEEGIKQGSEIRFNHTSMEFANSKSFILKPLFEKNRFNVLKNELHANISDSSSIEDIAEKSYKVVTVKNFLISLYGQANFDSIMSASMISEDLLNGLLNFTHFIRLGKDFPFDEMFDADELSGEPVGLIPATKEGSKSICRETIQYGLKRSAAFFAPELNYGVDLFLPVCFRGGILF